MNIQNFTNNSPGATGSQMKLAKPESPFTKLRKRGMTSIRKLADSAGKSTYETSIMILGTAQKELSAYVQGKGLVPSTNINKLIAQAALCRLQDIGKTALIFDSTDKAALEELEEAESQAYEIGTADADNALAPDVQAALTVVVDQILKKSQKANGIGNAKNLVKALSAGSPGRYNDNYNIGNLLVKDESAPDNASGTNIFDINAAASAGNGTDTGTSSVMGWINTITNAIGTVINAIKEGGGTIKDTVGSVKDSINDAGSDIGADSIQKFWDKNKWMIIGVLAVLVILIIIAIVYAKRK